MPEAKLQVTLLSHTPDPEETCALAARTCYSALGYGAHRSVRGGVHVPHRQIFFH